MKTPQDHVAGLETVRRRFLHLWCAADVGPAAASQDVLDAVAAMDEGATAIIRNQVWDVSHPCHGSTHGGGAPITPATAGITWYSGGPSGLAVVWACPLSRYHHDPVVLERLEASLRYIEPYLRPEASRHGSWYLWDIDWSTALARILIFCGDAMSASLRQSMNECLLSLPSVVFKVDREMGITEPREAGSNMMAVLQALLLRGVATGDAQWITAAAAQLPMVIGMVDGEGLQEDWSYHFHGRGLNAAYGLDALRAQAYWIYLTSGTPWACREKELNLHLGMIREFFRWNTWRGRVSPYSVDRGIAIPGTIYDVAALTAAMFGLVSGFSEAEQKMLASAARQCRSVSGEAFWKKKGPMGATISVLALETSSLIEKGGLDETGIRYYPSSEYLLAHQRGWFAAVRMASIRTKTWNSQNGQHIHGSSGAEFSIALMTDGWEFDHSTIPTMDWTRLMGVTRCDAIESPPEGYGQSAFVGGVADDGMAVLGKQYLLAPPGQSTLRANKSVFVTPEALILLGNRVCCDSQEEVVTTLFHAPLDEGAEYHCNGEVLDLSHDQVRAFQAGDLVFLRNVAVRLLAPAVLAVSTRRGSYKAMNAPNNPASGAYLEEYERRWAYLIAEHGVSPSNGEYGAVLWPGVSAHFRPEEGAIEIIQKPDHHCVRISSSRSGAEVRFPTDYRVPGGLSYHGAEPFKWGSIARWTPADERDRYHVTILPPQRYLRQPGFNTEIFLPDGLETENGTLVAMNGKPFPPNILSLSADNKLRTLRARASGASAENL